MSPLPVIHCPYGSVRLPDNASYENRFEIRSESSDAIYNVAQSKSGRWWSCSCLGWIRHKKCKHLTKLGLPGHHQAYEVSEVSMDQASTRKPKKTFDDIKRGYKRYKPDDPVAGEVLDQSGYKPSRKFSFDDEK